MRNILAFFILFILLAGCSEEQKRDREFKEAIKRHYESLTPGYQGTTIAEYNVVGEMPELSNDYATYYEVEVLVEVKSMTQKPYYGEDTFLLSWVPSLGQAGYHGLK